MRLGEKLSRSDMVAISEPELRFIKRVVLMYEDRFLKQGKEMLIRDVASGSTMLSEDLEAILGKYSLDQIINIVYAGNYAIKHTPEEKLARSYRKFKNSHSQLLKARAEGIELTLRLLDKKIEGINTFE